MLIALYFCLDIVSIAFLSAAGNKFADEAGQKEQYTYD